MKRINWLAVRTAVFYWALVVMLLMAASCAKEERVVREDCYCSPETIYETEPCRSVCGAIL